jgi:NADH-dependent peroxiredoxin subunit F
MKDELLDLVIIGAAAAGSAAAVYAARRHLNFLIVSKDIGGEVALSGEVENWPGTIHTTGFELSKAFHEHVKSYDVQIDEGWGVTKIEPVENYHIVHAENYSKEKREYKTKSVIVSSGIHPRTLGIPGEEELKGRGVTYCTVCDGPLFKGKTTATIGAGNSAVESALMMADIAEKVYVVTKYPNTPESKGGFPRAEDILVKKLREKSNVEFIYNASTNQVLGDGMTSGFKYKDNDSGEEKEVEVNGIMVHIGMIPNSQFVDCADKNQAGELKVNTRCETSCKGLFAAGDVTDVPFKQISISAGQGATAALSAIDYLNHWEA